MHPGLHGLPSHLHGDGNAVPGNEQLRLQDDENVDGLRTDVSDVRGLRDAQFRHEHADVQNVRRHVQRLRLNVRIDGEGRRYDDGLCEGVPPLL
jgi:hypothetical protein